MTLTAAIALLQAALSLLTFVSIHPELGQSARDNAMQVSQQAISAATRALQAQSAQNATVQTAPSSQATQTCPVVTAPTCSTYTPIKYNGCTIGYQCSSTPQAQTPASSSNTNPTTSSCTTPWGGKVVANGEKVSSQPYFTNGQYTRSVVVPMMRCTNGTWYQCDWQGNNCGPYHGIY